MAHPEDVRQPVSKEQVELVMSVALVRLLGQMRTKGNGSFVHRHEVMGCISEEWHEVIEAAHSRNRILLSEELYDLLCACAFGIASLEVMPERR